jgi:hypothetical protein
MEDFLIKGGRNEFLVPNVSLNGSTGMCEISGESSLEYTGEFYDQIMHWLKKFSVEETKTLTFAFKLTYFNTSSYKAILGTLRELKRQQSIGKNVVVQWYYPEDDTDMLMDAQDLMESADIELELIAHQPEE